MSRKQAWLVRIAIGLGALVLLAITAAMIMIGPRNVFGMLRYDRRTEGKLQVGDRAPDVTLGRLDSDAAANLRDFMGQKPLILIFGSYT